MKITYKHIEGYDKKYIVSNYGQVISFQRNRTRIMKPCLDSSRYKSVNLRKNGKPKNINVHILIGNAFVGKRINGLSFDHIDRVRTNNRADNLRLATKSEQEINKNMNSRNTTGERNVSIIRTGNYACYRIKIERNGKKIVKQLNMKTHTIADAIKYRDEQLELLSRI